MERKSLLEKMPKEERKAKKLEIIKIINKVERDLKSKRVKPDSRGYIAEVLTKLFNQVGLHTLPRVVVASGLGKTVMRNYLSGVRNMDRGEVNKLYDLVDLTERQRVIMNDLIQPVEKIDKFGQGRSRAEKWQKKVRGKAPPPYDRSSDQTYATLSMKDVVSKHYDIFVNKEKGVVNPTLAGSLLRRIMKSKEALVGELELAERTNYKHRDSIKKFTNYRDSLNNYASSNNGIRFAIRTLIIKTEDIAIEQVVNKRLDNEGIEEFGREQLNNITILRRGLGNESSGYKNQLTRGLKKIFSESGLQDKPDLAKKVAKDIVKVEFSNKDMKKIDEMLGVRFLEKSKDTIIAEKTTYDESMSARFVNKKEEKFKDSLSR